MERENTEALMRAQRLAGASRDAVTGDWARAATDSALRRARSAWTEQVLATRVYSWELEKSHQHLQALLRISAHRFEEMIHDLLGLLVSVDVVEIDSIFCRYESTFPLRRRFREMQRQQVERVPLHEAVREAARLRYLDVIPSMSEWRLPAGARVALFPSPTSIDRHVDRRRQMMTMLADAFEQFPPDPQQLLSSVRRRPDENEEEYRERFCAAWELAADVSWTPLTASQTLANLRQQPGETADQFRERYNEVRAAATGTSSPSSPPYYFAPEQPSSQPSAQPLPQRFTSLQQRPDEPVSQFFERITNAYPLVADSSARPSTSPRQLPMRS